MKLAEALIIRADKNKKMAQLRERILRALLVQEGELPPEDPKALLEEYDRTAFMLSKLVAKIQKTNALTPFGEGMTLNEALAKRETLLTLRNLYADAAATSSMKMDRYQRSELRTIAVLPANVLQSRVDEISKEYRELDVAIQQANWNVDLIE